MAVEIKMPPNDKTTFRVSIGGGPPGFNIRGKGLNYSKDAFGIGLLTCSGFFFKFCGLVGVGFEV